MKILLWFQGIVFTISLSLFLWRHPILLTIFLCIAALTATSFLKEKRRRKIEGYWVEYVSAGLLRGDENEFELTYHESRGDISFTGNGKIAFLSPNMREYKVPAWAKNERELVTNRVRKLNPKLCETAD